MARRIGVGALLLFCLLYGGVFAFIAPSGIPILLGPIVLLALVLIWALPDVRVAPTRAMPFLFWFLVAGLELWPNYLALALPGMPWITMIRLSGIPLALLLLICVSTSRDFRQTVARSVRAAPILLRLLTVFIVLQVVSIAFSKQPFFSLDRLLIDSISWTSVFFVSAYLFLVEGRLEKWAAFVWCMALVLCFIGLAEWRIHRPLWAGHVPSFLAMDSDTVQRELAGVMRQGSGQYRVQGTAGTPLGLAEYMALAIPFVLRFAMPPYKWWVRLAAMASVPLIVFVIVLTDSRLGLIGSLIAAVLFPFAQAVLALRRDATKLIPKIVLLIYPAVFLIVLGATFFVGRIHKIFFGSGVQAASTEGRKIQYAMGMPMVFKHPWGYGAGMGAETLGFRDQSGLLTIDTYYLLIALEYGVVGFFVYYGMILAGIVQAGALTVRAPNEKGRDFAFLLPIAIALTEFLVIKSVFSQQDNHPLIFMMLGAVAALSYRLREVSAARNVGATRPARGAFSAPPLRQG